MERRASLVDDVSPRICARFGERDSGWRVSRFDFERRQAFGDCRLPRRCGARFRRLRRAASRPWQSAVASVARIFLASLSSAPLSCFQPRDFVYRQIGEQPQEAPDIGVLGVAPELPIIVGRQLSAFSHTAPAAVLPILAPDEVVISGVVSAEQLAVRHAPRQLDAA